ncbi:MAG: hypothetical protein R3C97_12600 [Geminicoccaceae bacterium]
MSRSTAWRHQPLVWDTVPVETNPVYSRRYKHNTGIGLNARLLIGAMSLALWTGIALIARVALG